MVLTRSVRGTVLVELAIALPILLMLLSSYLWVSEILHSRSVFIAASGNAARLAITRASSEIFDVSPIPNLERVDESSPQSLAQLRALTALGVPSDFDVGDSLVHEANLEFDSVHTLSDIPVMYLYAKTYFAQAMKQVGGENLRIPCSLDLTDSQSCAECRIINLVRRSGAGEPPTRPPRERLSMACRMKYSLGAFAGIIRSVARPLGIQFAPYFEFHRTVVTESGVARGSL